MGFDTKYGKVTTQFGDIPDDEPVIVFRARDRLLPKVLAYYRLFCWKAGSPKRHLGLIDKTLERVEEWQSEHVHEVKMPDSERSREWLPE